MRQIHSNFALHFGGFVHGVCLHGVCLLDCNRKNTYHRAPKPGLVTLRLKSVATPSCRDSRLRPEKSIMMKSRHALFRRIAAERCLMYTKSSRLACRGISY
jgi:hypothetical protein